MGGTTRESKTPRPDAGEPDIRTDQDLADTRAGSKSADDTGPAQAPAAGRAADGQRQAEPGDATPATARPPSRGRADRAGLIAGGAMLAACAGLVLYGVLNTGPSGGKPEHRPPPPRSPTRSPAPPTSATRPAAPPEKPPSSKPPPCRGTRAWKFPSAGTPSSASPSATTAARPAAPSPSAATTSKAPPPPATSAAPPARAHCPHRTSRPANPISSSDLRHLARPGGDVPRVLCAG